MRVRPVDLGDLNAGAAQLADQASGVGAGRLATDNRDRTERLQPVAQRAIARRVRLKCRRSEQPSAAVKCRSDVRVGVRADATDDPCLDIRPRFP